MHRRHFLALAGTSALASTLPLPALAAAADPREALQTWYRLVLELVRHTATYSPPSPRAPSAIFRWPITRPSPRRAACKALPAS